MAENLFLRMKWQTEEARVPRASCRTRRLSRQHPTQTAVAVPAAATSYRVPLRPGDPPSASAYPHRFPRLMESLLASRSIRSSFSAVASTRGASPRPSRVATLAGAGAGARPLRVGPKVRLAVFPRVCLVSPL